MENSERDGNTRPPDMPPEKSVTKLYMTAERGYNDLNSAKNQNNLKKNNIVIREDKIKERREENFKVFKLKGLPSARQES